jgi:hypothetical protein
VALLGRPEGNVNDLVTPALVLVSGRPDQKFSPFALKDSCITTNCTVPSAFE